MDESNLIKFDTNVKRFFLSSRVFWKRFDESLRFFRLNYSGMKDIFSYISFSLHFIRLPFTFFFQFIFFYLNRLFKLNIDCCEICVRCYQTSLKSFKLFCFSIFQLKSSIKFALRVQTEELLLLFCHHSSCGQFITVRRGKRMFFYEGNKSISKLKTIET